MLSLAIALAGGLYASYVDFHATQAQAPMLVVLVSAFIAGAVHPPFAWLAALLIPACLTAAHLVAPSFGITPVDPGHLGNPLSLMIIALPAAAAAYLGAGLRWLVARTLTIV